MSTSRGDAALRKYNLSDAAVSGFGLTLAVLVIGGVLGYVNARRMADNSRLVARTHEVIGELDAVLSSLQDAETGQRGYLLTEDEKYLQPYDNALGRVSAQIARLQEFTSGNAEQQARLAALEPKVAGRLDELRRTVAAMKTGDRAAALQAVRSDTGKALMDDVRQHLAAMRQAEQHLLRQRADEFASSYLTTVVSSLLTALVGLVLVVVVFSLSQRSVRQRRRAAQVLAEQRERLRVTLASIGDAVLTTDGEGRITYLNAVAESLTGWQQTEAAGRPLEDIFRIVNEQTRQPVENPVKKVLAEGKVVGLANHTVLIAKDGTERPIDDSAAPIGDAAGRVLGVVLIFRDVAERRRAEIAQADRTRLMGLRAEVGTALAGGQPTPAALQKCCEALVGHLDAAFARIWTLNEPGDVLELQASAGLYTHLDGPHSRVPVGQFKIGRIARSRQPHLTNDVPNDPNVSDPEWAKRERMIAFAGYPLLVEGRVVGVVALFARRPLSEMVLTDLAPLAEGIAQYIDRKRSEQALHESERRLRFVMDSMPQKIFTATPNGDVDYFNPIWTQFTGLSFEQIRDWGWTQFIHPDDVAENVRVWRQAIDTGEPFQFEHRFRRADGEYRWHISRAVPMRDEAGRTVMWIGSNTDIHEQRQTANQLRQYAADLSEADRRKNEFLAMLAHELRNPLAPIRNAVQILRLTGGPGEAIASASAMMERQVGQMVRLVDDLLDVSRISRGRIELRRGRVELASVVHHAVEASRPAMESAQHALTVALPPQPVYLNADPTRLAQVVGNLLNNACKFTDTGGRISLTVECADEQAVIRVRDTGIGIAADQLPRIFDMFVQVDTSLERSVSGLGIGLTLVKSLVEMHGGTVAVHSGGIGHGSEFVVRWPVAVETPLPPPEPTANGPPPTTARRILVVDDNRDSAESLALLLQLAGHETHTAHDGLEAVAATAAFQPDVVLLDIGLPKLNGYEAARRIREQPGGQDMVLVALTGWGQDEDRQKSRAAGFNFHLVKPVDHAALEKLLAGLPAIA